MKIGVDRDLCQGHAACVSEAPEVFALDGETDQVRVLDEAPGEALHTKVRAAVKYCPTHALTVEDD